MTHIPLKVLIVDPTDSSSDVLSQALKGMSDTVLSVKRTSSVAEAQRALAHGDINAVYVDPLSLGLEAASRFIFKTRRRLPCIVFVLYLEIAHRERFRSEFYSGERRRFGHYYTLDKLTPAASFSEEVRATVRQCQSDLAFNLVTEKIGKLLEKLPSFRADTSAEMGNATNELRDIQQHLAFLKARQQEKPKNTKPKTVFVSYRLADSEYFDGLRALLEQEGFSVITGQYVNSYISQAILERIRECEFFLSLMTRAHEKKDGTFVTSPWLLEEKGAAIAMGKRFVLMVEDAVNATGGLAGDWQWLPFTAKDFTRAAIRAVDQLKSYCGMTLPKARG